MGEGFLKSKNNIHKEAYMSVKEYQEYRYCNICGESFDSNGTSWNSCSNCESDCCPECNERNLRKFGKVKSEDLIEIYGSDSLDKCERCSE